MTICIPRSKMCKELWIKLISGHMVPNIIMWSYVVMAWAYVVIRYQGTSLTWSYSIQIGEPASLANAILPVNKVFTLYINSWIIWNLVTFLLSKQITNTICPTPLDGRYTRGSHAATLKSNLRSITRRQNKIPKTRIWICSQQPLQFRYRSETNHECRGCLNVSRNDDSDESNTRHLASIDKILTSISSQATYMQQH